jgi:prophage DNA circulation protein
MTWRDTLRPASFRGVEFKVDTTARTGGRRGVNFQFPKCNTPSDEDMGRASQGWIIDGYVIGPDYNLAADDLEGALNAPGPGLLIHPTMGEMQVRAVAPYTRAESKDRGGFAAFNMRFVEVGTQASDLVSEPTQAQLQNQADSASSTLSTNANNKAISL